MNSGNGHSVGSHGSDSHLHLPHHHNLNEARLSNEGSKRTSKNVAKTQNRVQDIIQEEEDSENTPARGQSFNQKYQIVS